MYVSYAYTFTILVAPTFVVSPMDVTVTERDDALFTCTVTGRPRPSIRWAFVQQESCTTLPSTIQLLNETSEDYTFERIEMGERELESTLTVTSTLPSDTGCYVCLADNEVVGREASANALLTVEGKQCLIQSLCLGDHKNIGAQYHYNSMGKVIQIIY